MTSQVNEEAVNQLLSMGFKKEQIVEALIVCNNQVDVAAEYLISHPTPSTTLPQQQTSTSSTTTNISQTATTSFNTSQVTLNALNSVFSSMFGSKEKAKECKMVLIVRQDLEMGKGKIAAQCCHAAVGIYRGVLRQELSKQSSLNKQFEQWLNQWEYNAEPKIALKINSEKDLLELENKARTEFNLPTYIVVDAGRTQIAPMSKTVLAIGPAPADIIDKVSGHLKLL